MEYFKEIRNLGVAINWDSRVNENSLTTDEYLDIANFMKRLIEMNQLFIPDGNKSSSGHFETAVISFNIIGERDCCYKTKDKNTERINFYLNTVKYADKRKTKTEEYKLWRVLFSRDVTKIRKVKKAK